MKILCTGGAGYVGSACLRWLLKHGHDAVAYDDLSAGNARAVPADRLITGDILDAAQLTQALKDHGSEAVMHFAAVASVPESIAQPELYYRVNVIGTKHVLDAMVEADVKRLVFSSTAATYSFDVPMPITEDAPKDPKTPYGSTKLAAERMIDEYAAAYGLGFVIMRYFNASGADPDGRFGEARRRETHLIPLILQTALGQREKIVIHGNDWDTRDGTCVRDFVHTDDLALAHQLAVERLEGGYRETYNIGSGAGVTVLEALRACERAVGEPIPHEFAARRPGDPAVLIAGAARLAEQLGWRPRLSGIDEIVATAWAWHRAHPHGYDRVSS